MSKKIGSLILLSAISLQSVAEFKDPTQPTYPVNSEAKVLDSEQEPRLTAIRMSAKARWATINGAQVKQGQSLPGNITLIKIRKNTVIINQNGSIKTLQLLQRPYKTSQYKGHVLND